MVAVVLELAQRIEIPGREGPDDGTLAVVVGLIVGTALLLAAYRFLRGRR